MKHAPIPPPTIDTGELSDFEYFTARPGVTTRIRLPFENEYPICVLEPGRCAFVRIEIDRDADGALKRRARRRLRFCAGGHA